jgi:hypothetical protein
MLIRETLGHTSGRTWKMKSHRKRQSGRAKENVADRDLSGLRACEQEKASQKVPDLVALLKHLQQPEQLPF